MLIETAAKLWQREEGDYRDDVSNEYTCRQMLTCICASMMCENMCVDRESERKKRKHRKLEIGI
jgi:hypothetical protein